jgi:hypothetical protein
MKCIGQAYKGGNEALYKIMSNNLKYPAEDRRDGTTGKVLIKFKVRNGVVDSLEVINQVSPTIDAEAIRILQLTSGNWLLKSTDFFLFPLTFELDVHPNPKALISKRDKLMNKKKYSDALPYCEQIKRLNPNDIDNLDKLIVVYSELHQTGKSKDATYLREQIQKLTSIFKLN